MRPKPLAEALHRRNWKSEGQTGRKPMSLSLASTIASRISRRSWAPMGSEVLRLDEVTQRSFLSGKSSTLIPIQSVKCRRALSKLARLKQFQANFRDSAEQKRALGHSRRGFQANRRRIPAADRIGDHHYIWIEIDLLRSKAMP